MAERKAREVRPEPLWHSLGPTQGFHGQMATACVVDLDRAEDAGSPEALSAWWRKWGPNVRRTLEALR